MGRKKKTPGAVAEISSDKRYFTEVHEAAIVAYNNSDDSDEREYLYVTVIAKALDKLAESVINRFKFPYVNQSFDDTKRQVISFLVINLHKYTADKGKAFSYLSVIAKNYLILHNSNGWKEEKRSVYLSENGDEHVSIDDLMQLESPDVHEHEDIQEFVELMIVYWERHITHIFKKKRDIHIALAVVELFRRANGIENFNKKALYLMVREMTDCKTSYITKVVNKMKEHTDMLLIEFFQHGTVYGNFARYE